ncbi:OmpA family protein [Marinomonas profundimaris]|uniref:Thrombospondin n=1 Tax=Marinomonas profundimaris TaxID=1208321 RepID=W1RYZ7_9GAMM|nr:OmpA family protein [Marinomonas profundimaris]ETI62416.1 thrombospondin [Marinomonas profundimaris]
MIARIARIAIVFFGLYSASSICQPLYSNIPIRSLADSDFDGVIDARDKCRNTPIGSDIDNTGCPLTTLELFSFHFDIQFKIGKHQLAPEFHSRLKALAYFLQQAPNTLILIEGYTDNIGVESYNIALSKRRAESIAKALITSFNISPNRIKTFGYGQHDPLASNETEVGRKANRRVNGHIVIPFQYDKPNTDSISDNQPNVDHYNVSVPFSRNRYGIKTPYRPSIESLGQLLQDNEDTLVIIEGHTDNTGSKKYNVALSLERANNIADLLNTQFAIHPSRLKVLGHGPDRPMKPNDTQEGRKSNRRVDMEVVKEFKVKKEVIVPKWTIWSVDQMQ